ncbi:LacI family DNA-binding transcriptional regulator [Treponema sp.]
MRVTIKHIAELAAVSKTAVSFAFNDPSKLSRKTYEHIMAIATREGYVPDPIARSMTTKRAGAIGVLLPQAIQDSLRNPYVAEVLRGIGTVCHQEDLFLTVISPLRGFLSQAIRTAVVDGFVALGVEATSEIAELIKQRQVPFVTIDGDPDMAQINIGIDDTAAAMTVMEHVLSKGHRRIIIMTLHSDTATSEEERYSDTGARRMEGFRRALKSHGLSLEGEDILTVMAEPNSQDALEAISPLLDTHKPTAIVCMSDAAAHGAYRACRAAKLRIPEDVSITGFDDTPLAELLDPALTTVRQPGLNKGSHAARAVVDLIHGQSAASFLLPTELMVRSSVAEPPVQ